MKGASQGFLELQRPWGFSPEALQGPQGASRVARGKSGLRARGEGEHVIALESWEGTRASRRVEEGLSRSFSGCGRKPSFPSTSAGDLRELARVPLRCEGCCGVGGASRDPAGWCKRRGPHLEWRQETQASPPFRTPTAGSLQSWDRRVRPRLV